MTGLGLGSKLGRFVVPCMRCLLLYIPLKISVNTSNYDFTEETAVYTGGKETETEKEY